MITYAVVNRAAWAQNIWWHMPVNRLLHKPAAVKQTPGVQPYEKHGFKNLWERKFVCNMKPVPQLHWHRATYESNHVAIMCPHIFTCLLRTTKFYFVQHNSNNCTDLHWYWLLLVVLETTHLMVWCLCNHQKLLGLDNIIVHFIDLSNIWPTEKN